MYLIMFKFGYGWCLEADNFYASLVKNQSSTSEEVRQMESRLSVFFFFIKAGECGLNHDMNLNSL